jgi:hypothetical protein
MGFLVGLLFLACSVAGLPNETARLVTVPLTGGGVAGGLPFVADVILGGQRVRLIPDTASPETVVATPQCQCGHYGAGYAPHASATAAGTSCGVCNATSIPTYLRCALCSSSFCGTCRTEAQWVDGSAASGYDYRDQLQISSFVTPLFVGAAFEMSGALADAGCDGVLGLGFATRGVPALMDTASAEGGLENAFSLCFGLYSSAVLTLGGVDPSRVAPGSRQMVLTIDKSLGTVQLAVSAIRVQQHAYEPVLHGAAVLASRSPFIDVSPIAFASLTSWIDQAISASASAERARQVLSQPEEWSCFSRAELASFVPCLAPLEFTFVGGGDQSVLVPASSYFGIFENVPACPQYAVRLALRSRTLPPGVEFVLGFPFLRSVHVAVDRTAGRATLSSPAANMCGSGLANVTDTNVCVPYAAQWLAVLPNWGVALVVVVSVVLLVAAIVIIVCCCRRRRKSRRDRGDFMLADAGSFDPSHEESMSLFPQ